MSIPWVHRVRLGFIAAGVILYPLLAHYSTATSAATTFPSLGVAVSLTPPLALLLGLAWRSSRPLAMLLPCVVGCFMLGWFWDALERHFEWVYFMQHVGTHISLALLFGLTLAPRRQPICTRFAAAVRGDLEPEVIRYTRQLTMMWTIYFLVISLISSVLFLFGSIDMWSAFANFMTIPIILFIFAAEYRVRRRRLPHLKHFGIMASILAFRDTPKVDPSAALPNP